MNYCRVHCGIISMCMYAFLILSAVYYSKLRELANGSDLTTHAFEGSGICLPDSEFGETLELCAGIIDDAHGDPIKTAVQEVFEECGYRISEDSLRSINKFR